jgi:tripartite-type tricarboxylate transporter receptor subunit TctC
MLKPFMSKSLVLLAVLSFLPLESDAQTPPTYPNRPIKLVVPFAPGGTTDVLARMLASKMADGLGQPMVIENKPGAGGNIGAESVAKSVPDGYTLLVGTPGPLAINASLYKSISFDASQDFLPIAQFVSVQSVLITHPTQPFKTVAELIAYAKANPNKLSFASAGAGSSPHLAAELFKANAGITMEHIAYKGDTPALTDLLGGQVPIMFANIAGVLPHLKSGRVRALAVAGPRRSPALPEVPTIAEAGMNGFSVTGYAGLVAPKGTPPTIISRLATELRKAMANQELIDKITQSASEPVNASTESFAELLKSEQTRWPKVIRDAKISLE